MKILKRNQIVIYTFALMLITAGYFNYTNNIKDETEETVSNEIVEEVSNEEQEQKQEQEQEEEENKVADIGDATLVSTSPVVEDYFAKSKIERQSMYSQMLESYENILNSSNSQDAQKQTATEEIAKINNTQNSIMICENLIKTKGFENCVIFVNGDSVSAIIGTEELEKEDIAQIQNIISRELNVEIENIHISTK